VKKTILLLSLLSIPALAAAPAPAPAPAPGGGAPPPAGGAATTASPEGKGVKKVKPVQADKDEAAKDAAKDTKAPAPAPKK
jgi:hypothetical protein